MTTSNAQWAKWESEAGRMVLAFERVDGGGAGKIEVQQGTWRAIAIRGGKRQSQEITRDKAIAMAAQIRAKQDIFRITFDGHSI